MVDFSAQVLSCNRSTHNHGTLVGMDWLGYISTLAIPTWPFKVQEDIIFEGLTAVASVTDCPTHVL